MLPTLCPLLKQAFHLLRLLMAFCLQCFLHWRALCLSLSHACICRNHRVWRKDCQVLLKTVKSYKHKANKHKRPAPTYRPGQKVWLSTSHLHFRVDNKKLAPRFVRPFSVIRLINPSAVRLGCPDPCKFNLPSMCPSSSQHS